MSPLRLPRILMTPINDCPELMLELIALMRLAMTVAFPDVALPAVVFESTVALPLFAARLRSLLICPFSLVLIATELS